MYFEIYCNFIYLDKPNYLISIYLNFDKDNYLIYLDKPYYLISIK